MAMAWPRAIGTSDRTTARVLFSCIPRATAKSQPIPGFTPWYAPRRNRAGQPQEAAPLMRPSSCVAVGVGGGVAAFEAYLVTAQLAELQEEVRIDFQAALGFGIELYHPAPDALGIELHVPRRIERVGEIDAPAVAADLDHLRTAVQRGLGLLGMRRVAHDAAEVNRGGLLGVERIGNVVLKEFAGAPAGDVEKTVVERKVDVGDQGRHGFEPLQHGRKLFRIG